MQTIKINPALTAIKTTVGGQSFATGNLFKNLMLWMPLTTEWANGTTVLDRGPYKLHSAVSGNPVIGAGSTAFDGTGDFIIVDDDTQDRFSFTNTSNFSIGFYVKTSSVSCGLLGRRNAQGWVIQITAGGKLDFFLDTSAGNSNTASTTSINGGVWTSVIAVFTSGATPARSCFINGASDSITGGAVALDFANAGLDMYVGSRNAGAAPIVGSMRDVMIWNRVLTLQDAQQYHKQMQSLNLS